LCKMGVFEDISFSLKKGEILGITGLIGAGRSEVCQAIFGIMPYERGNIYLEGEQLRIRCPEDAMKLGIGYLPEDRQKQGLVLNWEIARNITLPALGRLSNNGWLNDEKESILAKTLSEKMQVKANSIFDCANLLSGGNQQKVVVAKLLTSDLKVIILDEPTKGVDVGAKSAIHEIMSDLACQGYGVVLISSEMPEVLGMCDRIAVMREGRITTILSRDEATQEAILEAAMAVKIVPEAVDAAV
jgi:rhamnose transport system ATP-binding protein